MARPGKDKKMASSPLPHLGYCDVETRQGLLFLRMRKEASQQVEANWWVPIIDYCQGPFQGLWIDLFHCPVVSSSFVAGALQLLEHYRNEQLQRIILLNVSDRVVRLVDIMNLQDFFVVRQHDSPQ